MKLVLAVVLLAGLACADVLSDADKLKLKTISKECIESTHVPESILVNMRNNKFENDPRLKEYLFCIFKKMGWQAEDGKFIKENVKTFASKDTISAEAMKPCVDKEGANGPETAYTVFKCYKLNLPTGYKSTL